MHNDGLLGVIIPIYFAIATAVIKLSPVTILILIPALLHWEIALETSGLGRSLTPNIASKIKF